MDKQNSLSYRNFEKSSLESEFHQSTKINVHQTLGSVSSAVVTQANMLISSMNSIQGANVIPSGSLSNSSYPLHIHLAGGSGSLPSTLSLPVQIPNTNVNLNVPMQFPSVNSGVPIKLTGTAVSVPVQNTIPTNNIPMQLSSGTTINVPLQIQNNNNVHIAGQTLSVPMQLQNTSNQPGLHGSIIHLHMGQNQARKSTQSVVSDKLNEARSSIITVPGTQIQQQEVGNRQIDAITHVNNTGSIQVESSAQHVPLSSAAIAACAPSTVHPLQMRPNNRTMPQFVYIQTPTGLKPVSGTEVVNNASTANPPQIIVRRPVTSSGNIQFLSTQSKNISSKCTYTTNSTITSPHNQPIVIQKPKLTTTNVMPVSIAGRPSYTYVPLASNKISANSGKVQDKSSLLLPAGHITPDGTNSSNQNVFIAPGPKLPSTKFILPMSLPATMSSKGPIINLQISNGQLQNDPQGNITVMRDAISNSNNTIEVPIQTNKTILNTNVEKDTSTFAVSQNENSYSVSIPGSRVEPTGEREYSLSIPETNSTLGDDMYTVSIKSENGNEEYMENISLITDKDKHSAASVTTNFRRVGSSVPAPAILRRSNSEYVEKKIHSANTKRRISLCTDGEREKMFKIQENNIENFSNEMIITETTSNYDITVPSLFCDEKFDKDLDSRVPLREAAKLESSNSLLDVNKDEELLSITSRLSKHITLIPKRNEALEGQVKDNQQYISHKNKKLKNSVKNYSLMESKEQDSSIVGLVDYSESKIKDFPAEDESLYLNWNDGVGILNGSMLKFKLNEFGLLDIAEEIKLEMESSLNKHPSKHTPYVAHTERTFSNRKIASPEDLYCCDGCGCHGVAAEFVTPNFCSHSCQTNYQKQHQAKIKDLGSIKRLQRKKKLIIMKKDSDFLMKPSTEISKYDLGAIVTSGSDGDNSKISDCNIKNVDGASWNNQKYPWMCGESGFSWTRYLEHSKAKQAPDKLFKNPFPYAKNPFRVDMKMEAIDPSHSAIFTVVSVRDIQGYRLRLHFDGYDNNYDFWVNADSIDIFPPGWCEKNDRVLQPPLGYSQSSFSWQQYLKQSKGIPAPRQLFHHVSSSNLCPNGFRVGMKLEAEDRKNNLICVATVADTMDNRILVRFDSWDDIYDYWVEPSSPYIHPVGWCDENAVSLTPPNSCKDPDNFTWESYLSETLSTAVPARAFKTRVAHSFKPNMKLEVVDRRVPFLIRVATITDTRSYQLRISFDGWPDELSYWVDDDSPDIHPVGWCLKTGHPLEPPLTEEERGLEGICGTKGCKGLGSTQGPSHTRHSTSATCPYCLQSTSSPISPALPDRLAASRPPPECTVPRPREPKRGRPPKVLNPSSEPQKEKVPLPRGRPPKHRKLEASIKSESQVSDDESNSSGNPVKRWRRFEGENHSTRGSATDGLVQNIEDNIESNDLIVRQGRMAPVSWGMHGCRARPSLNSLLVGSSILESDPRNWDHGDVADFVSRVSQRSDLAWYFSKHLMDGESLIMISQEELVDVLGLKLGPAMKIYDSIVQLRERIQ